MTGSFRSFRTARRVSANSRLALELLESRDTPATITVTNLLDDTTTGNGVSLREALEAVNNGADSGDVVATGAYGSNDTILFAAGVTGTINTTSQLEIYSPVTVTGPGSAALNIHNTAAGSRVVYMSAYLETVTISGVTISGGSANFGGGIYLNDGELRLNDVTVSGNTATQAGGGIWLYFGTAQLSLTNSTVSNNSATAPGGGFLNGDGGGIAVRYYSSVSLTNTTVSGNTAADTGGGIYFYFSGDLTVDNSTISGNIASTHGGGIYLYNASATIRNSTIAGNLAGMGGGIGAFAGTSLQISNSTIANNIATDTSANSSGGISNLGGGSVTLVSTIVAANFGGAGAENVDLGIDSNTLTANSSLIGVVPSTLTVNGANNQTGTDAAPLDPLLGGLANYGGPTQTMSLLEGSPAIDAGSGLGPDQRGLPLVGQRDIGAYEFTPVPGPPHFSSSFLATFLAGSSGSFTVRTSGFPAATLSVTGGTLPSGLSFVPNANGTATIVGTPAANTGGLYSLTIHAVNSFGSVNQTLFITVNQKPAFTSSSTATFTAGVAGSFSITTSGYPNATVTVTSGNLPAGLRFVPGSNGAATIIGTANSPGPYTVTLQATNGINPLAIQTLTISVVLPPIIVSANTATFTEGTAGTFTVTGVGTPLPALSVTGTLPAGVTFTYNGNGLGTLTGTPAAGTAGSYNLTFVAINGASPNASQSFTLLVLPPPVAPPPPPLPLPPLPPPPPPPPPPTPTPDPLPSHPAPVVLVGSPNSGPNGSEVRVLDIGTFQVVKTFTPFPGFSGNISTAFGDLNGDGVVDYVVGAGTGGGPHVKVIDGRSGDELRSFFAFADYFHGGVSVAVGDVNGDGHPDVIVAAGPGGGPHVKVYEGTTFAEIRSFYAYDAGFTGGVNVGAADLNGDGRDEILTGAKSGGGPHVKAFDGLTLAEVLSFYAFDADFTGGVSVAGGDLNGDGVDEIIVGKGIGDSPTVRVFNGAGGQVSEFLAYSPTFAGGVNVAAADLNADGRDEIVTGAGPSGGPHVKAFDGMTLTELFSVFTTDPSFHGGVLVG